MAQDKFKAFLVDKIDEQPQASLQSVEPSKLPIAEVLIDVAYSSLNYKDALAVTGQGQVIRRYPMVPGIDLAGTVIESEAAAFKPGAEVLVTGWGIGETHWGGYAQRARMKADWLTPLPQGLSLKQAMAIGTAGFTAMLAVNAMEERGLRPDTGEVVVTGATGGLGSIAVAILGQLGYQVVASTGRTEAEDYLRQLGANEIIERSLLGQPPERPMESARWAGAVDVVGGDTLASLLATMAPNSNIAVCGLAGGSHLQATVFPLILRGVSLLGINSVMVPGGWRQRAWDRLAGGDLPLALLDQITQIEPLSNIVSLSQQILDGQTQGRIVIDVNA